MSFYQKLAPQHFETLFLRINVAYVPFLVTKLDIKVLPCVMSFINGAVKDKYVSLTHQSHRLGRAVG